MDTVLGLLELTVYVIGILSLSAAVTFLVVKISPAKSAKAAKPKADKA